MKYQKITCLIALMALILPVQGLTAAKHMTLDLEKVFRGYSQFQQKMERFRSSQENAESELQQMYDDLRTIGTELQEMEERLQNPALTDDGRMRIQQEMQEKGRQFQAGQMDFQRYQQETQQMLQSRQQSIINLHLSEIRDVVAEVAREKGAEIVLNTNGLAVIYADPTFDVTDDIIAKLNAQQD